MLRGTSAVSAAVVLLFNVAVGAMPLDPSDLTGSVTLQVGNASFEPPTGETSTFNQIVATKYFDLDPRFGVGVTFPADSCPSCEPPPTTFFKDGFLPADSYQLTIDQGGSDRVYAGTSDSAVSLTLSPIPEFSTLVLGLLGLGSLAMWRRHQSDDTHDFPVIQRLRLWAGSGRLRRASRYKPIH